MIETLELAILAQDHDKASDFVAQAMADPAILDEGARALLADLYRSGDTNRRRFIVHSVLEHLLENVSIAQEFRLWEEDPLLREATHEAREWAESLARKRDFLSPIASRTAAKLRTAGFADASVDPPVTGIDSVSVTWSAAGERRVLVLDCGDSVLTAFRDRAADASEVERWANLAAEPTFWKADDFSPRQYWFEVQASTGET